MDERYKRVYYSGEMEYFSGSSVVIEARALLHDLKQDCIVGQVKLLNISEKVIVAVFATVALYNAAKDRIGTEKHEYLDLNVRFNSEFGQKTKIKISESNARYFDLVIDKVVYENGEVWENVNSEKEIIPEATLLTDVWGHNAAEGFKLKFGCNNTYYPIETKWLWKCSCGQINLKNNNVCSKCRNNKINQFESLDANMLEEVYFDDCYKLAEETERFARDEKGYKDAANKFEQLNGYKDSALKFEECNQLAQEAYKNSLYFEAEKLSGTGNISEINKAIEIYKGLEGWKEAKDKIDHCKEKIAQINAEQSRSLEKKKKKMIMACLAVGILAIIIFSATIILPGIKYSRAKALLSNKEYDQAISAFTELNGFKDAEDMVYECSYEKAEDLFEKGEFDAAIEIYESIENYKDSREKVATVNAEINYIEAVKLFNNKDYEGANTVFKGIKGYKDTDEYILECDYQKACNLYGEGKYAAAKQIFDELGDYKDTKEKVDECTIKMRRKKNRNL